MPNNRWIVLIVGAALLVLFILPAQLKPVNFLPDDTYYYLQVAYNITNGHGSTFNRIMPTNGYHPLWMLFCIAGMVMAGGDKSIAIHIILLIQALLFLGVISFFIRTAREAGVRYWGVGIPILALYFLTGLYGSEAHINALMVMMGLSYLLLAASDGRTRDWLLAGVFMGLAVLARLDNVFLIAAVSLFGIPAVRPREASARRSVLRDLMLFLVPVIVLVAPYLIYNAIAFGHILPISGAIKTSFPIITFNVGRLATLGMIVTLFGIIGLLCSFTGSPLRRLLLRVLGAAVLLQSIYITCFLEFGAGWSWYYVVGVLNAAFVAAVLFEMIVARLDARASSVPHWLAGSFIVLVLLAGVVRSWFKYSTPDFLRPENYATQQDPRAASQKRDDDDLRMNLGVWMKEHLPSNSGLLVEEGAGALAYYSDMRVIPLDGLIADYAYNEELLRLGADRYMAAHNVGYVVGTVDPHDTNEQRVRVVAPLYRRDAGTLTLRRENRLITMCDYPRPFDVGVWKISTDSLRNIR